MALTTSPIVFALSAAALLALGALLGSSVASSGASEGASERERERASIVATAAEAAAKHIASLPQLQPPTLEALGASCRDACAPIAANAARSADEACAPCAQCALCSSAPPPLPSPPPAAQPPPDPLMVAASLRESARALAPFSFPQLHACSVAPRTPTPGAPHGSQSHEDEWLWSTVFAALPPAEQVNGIFVELGALDGITYSNSLWFEKALGWRGLLIEGHPENSARLAEAARTVRTSSAAFSSSICPFAAPGVPGTLSFTTGGAATGAATEAAAEAFLKAHHGGQAVGTKRVDCVPMQALLDATGVLDIDLLSLDVEGAELLVLRTIDLTVTNIRVVVIELDGHDPAKDESCRTLLRNAGFLATPTSPRSACRPGEDCTANDAFINPRFAERKAARPQPFKYVPGTGTRCA